MVNAVIKRDPLHMGAPHNITVAKLRTDGKGIPTLLSQLPLMGLIDAKLTNKRMRKNKEGLKGLIRGWWKLRNKMNLKKELARVK
jgi:hypothetical protein